MMTRKHYAKFAKIINDLTNEDGTIQTDSLVHALAQVFVDDNARFDPRRFLDACKAQRAD